MKAYRYIFSQNIANVLTMLNISLGCVSIFLSINKMFVWAIATIALAGVADRYDGAVARHFNATSELGLQLDSLCDSISFGVAPAILSYMILRDHMHSMRMHLLLAFLCIVFICSGVYRLARYNVQGNQDGCFCGVPITVCGMVLALMYLFAKELSPYFYMALLPIFSVLMVSRLKLKKR